MGISQSKQPIKTKCNIPSECVEPKTKNYACEKTHPDAYKHFTEHLCFKHKEHNNVDISIERILEYVELIFNTEIKKTREDHAKHNCVMDGFEEYAIYGGDWLNGRQINLTDEKQIDNHRYFHGFLLMNEYRSFIYDLNKNYYLFCNESRFSPNRSSWEFIHYIRNIQIAGKFNHNTNYDAVHIQTEIYNNKRIQRIKNEKIIAGVFN